MDAKVLKLVYMLFLGIMLGLFVGFGVQTFYPQPEYPVTTIFEGSADPSSSQEKQLRKQQEAFQDRLEVYNRNVSIIATGAAVLMLGLSLLLLERRSVVLADGVMLGGLFTLLYGVGRGFASGDTATTFITVTVGLAVVLFLGYRRFMRHPHAMPPAAAGGAQP